MASDSGLFGRVLAVLACVGIAVLCAASFRLGVKWARNGQEGGITERVDTLYIRDTITRLKPVYLSREVVRVDTLVWRDTIAVPVEVERRVYADSNYRAVVSGWKPSLDTISVYPKTTIITKVQEVQVPAPARRWGVGVSAGYGMGKEGLTPYVGVGLTYNLLSW